MIFNLIVIVISLIAILHCEIANAQAITSSGYLADIYCMNLKIGLDGSDMIKSPQDHLVGCLLEPPCKASGYAVIVNTAPSTSPTKNYEIKYIFDATGNNKTVDFLLDLKAKGVQKDVYVKVDGSIVSGNMISVSTIALTKADVTQGAPTMSPTKSNSILSRSFNLIVVGLPCLLSILITLW